MRAPRNEKLPKSPTLKTEWAHGMESFISNAGIQQHGLLFFVFFVYYFLFSFKLHGAHFKYRYGNKNR